MAILNDYSLFTVNQGGGWATMFAQFDGIFTSLAFTSHSPSPQKVAIRLFKPGIGNVLFHPLFELPPYGTAKMRIPPMHMQSAGGEGFEFFTTGPVTATCTGMWIAGAPATNALYVGKLGPGWNQVLDQSGWKAKTVHIVNKGSGDCNIGVRIRSTGDGEQRAVSTEEYIPEGQAGRIVFNNLKLPPGWVLDMYCTKPINTFFSAVIA